MKKFEDIDHTADIAFKVFGKDLKELFENAAFAMYSHIIDIQKVRAQEKAIIRVEGADEGELLINWLNELNFLTQTRHIVFSSFSVTHIDRSSLKAQAVGEKYDSSVHGELQEIKAVTFHLNGFVKTEEGLECPVVCDV